jgi:transcriptional regulator with XRE-family HTH domain
MAQELVMQDKEFRSAFGARLKSLRKQKEWTQKELAARVNIRFMQLNKYEAGLNMPPAEKLMELAQALDTTVDYLLTGSADQAAPIYNTRLLERFRALAEFESDDQETVIKLIDALIVQRRVQRAMGPVERRAG